MDKQDQPLPAAAGSRPPCGTERPVLFSGPMVRAILEGRKTQTRRICPVLLPGDKQFIHAETAAEWVARRAAQCRFGQPGDRLWVRECFARSTDGEITYRATVNQADYPNDFRWRPSIHMPRLDSRITLDITGIRVERLQEISEADAIAEGMQMVGPASTTDRGSFAQLWQSINGHDSWTANPFVWVIEFRRLQETSADV